MMKQIQPVTGEQSLGELAARTPVLIPKFFEKGLDFCCGGDRTLAEACTAKSLDPQTVADELNALVQSQDRETSEQTWGMDRIGSLIDHILARYHEGHRAVFPGLAQMMTKVLRVHGERHPFLADLKTNLDQLIADLEPHMQKEEIVLFPLIRFLIGDAEKAPAMCHGADPSMPIQVMRVEHEDAGALLARIRTLTNCFQPPDGACRTFTNLYTSLEELDREVQQHIHLENNVLFPLIAAFQDKHQPAAHPV